MEKSGANGSEDLIWIIDNFIKKTIKSYLQLIRLKKKKKLFIQKHYLQFLSI